MNPDRIVARLERKIGRLLARRVADAGRSTPVDPILAACRDSYPRYVREYLRAHPTPQQLAIADALHRPPYRVLVPSANNQGKTWCVASLARHFYDRYNPSVTLITATTAVQVRDGVFKELRRLSPDSRDFMPRATRIESAPDHYIHGFTAATPDGFQGRHDTNLGIAFDEATGIPLPFWERAETMFGGHEGHWWVCTYNPNDVGSPAYLAEESGLWTVIRLCALDHINIAAELRGLPPPVPSAIRLGRVLDRITAECEPADPPRDAGERAVAFEFPRGSGIYWEPKTNAFEAQVLGRWPLLPTDTIFSPAQIDRCFETHFPLNLEWKLAAGVDVARFGSDSTCIIVRRGPCVLHIETLNKRDTTFIARRVAEVLTMYATDDRERYRTPIYIDDTGGYGGGVVDQLTGYNAVGVNFAAKPDVQQGRYARNRDYVWGNMVEIVNAGGLDLTRVPADIQPRMRQELIAPRSRLDESGRRKIEPKTHIRERLGFSPDIADTLGLSFYGL